MGGHECAALVMPAVSAAPAPFFSVGAETDTQHRRSNGGN